MYYIILLSTIVFSLISKKFSKMDKPLFILEIVLMTAVLCFRFGQGSDYFGYELNYNILAEGMSWRLIHGEIGYTFLCWMFITLGANFKVFILVISAIMMINTYRGIIKLSEFKMLSLVLLYSTYYLTFYSSAIREGLILSVVIGWLLPLYLDEKYNEFIIVTIISATIHSSCIIMLFLVLFKRTSFIQNRYTAMFISFLGGLGVAVVLKFTGLHISYIYYSPSIFAILLRIVLFIVMDRMYVRYGDFNKNIKKLYNVYLVGLFLYFALWPMALLSHRVTAYLKITEVILFPNLYCAARNYMPKFMRYSFKRIAYVFICLLCFTESLKNMESYARQSRYVESIKFYNYPYISVFAPEKSVEILDDRAKKKIDNNGWNLFYNDYREFLSALNEVFYGE